MSHPPGWRFWITFAVSGGLGGLLFTRVIEGDWELSFLPPWLLGAFLGWLITRYLGR